MDGFNHIVNKSYRIVSDNGVSVGWEYCGADSELDYRIHIGRSYGDTFTHFDTFTEEFAKQVMKALKGNENNTYFEVTIEENNTEMEVWVINHYEQNKRALEDSISRFILFEETIERYTKETSKEIEV